MSTAALCFLLARPQVVLGWYGAQDRHVAKYSGLLEKEGYPSVRGVLPGPAVFSPLPFPRRRFAAALLNYLAALDPHGERKLVFYAFSNGEAPCRAQASSSSAWALRTHAAAQAKQARGMQGLPAHHPCAFIAAGLSGLLGRPRRVPFMHVAADHSHLTQAVPLCWSMLTSCCSRSHGMPRLPAAWQAASLTARPATCTPLWEPPPCVRGAACQPGRSPRHSSSCWRWWACSPRRCGRNASGEAVGEGQGRDGLAAAWHPPASPAVLPVLPQGPFTVHHDTPPAGAA